MKRFRKKTKTKRTPTLSKFPRRPRDADKKHKLGDQGAIQNHEHIFNITKNIDERTQPGSCLDGEIAMNRRRRKVFHVLSKLREDHPPTTKIP